MAESKNFFTRLFGGQSDESRDWNPDAFFSRQGNYQSNIGLGDTSAYSSATGRACSKLIADTVANTPIVFKKKGRDGTFTLADHPITNFFTVTPDGHTAAFDFMHALAYDMVNHGVAYAEIEKTDSVTTGLNYISPTKVTVQKDGSFAAEYVNQWGRRDFRVIEKGDMMAIYATKGVGVMTAHRDLFELESFLLTYTRDFFKKGATYGNIISFPPGLKPAQVESLKRTIREISGQAGNHGTAALPAGTVSLHRTTAGPDEANVTDLQQKTQELIAQTYGVPAALVGLPANITFNNMENQNMLFVQKTVQPLLTRIAQEIMMRLFTPAEAKKWAVTFDTDYLLRGDSKTQSEVYSTYLNSGIMTANEVRAELGLSPMEGGDTLKTPLNLVDATEDTTEETTKD